MRKVFAFAHRPRGLRARLTTALAVGALVLSLVVAVVSFELSQHYLLRQRETTATRQAWVNARLVRTGLEAAHVDVSGLLASLQTPTSSASVLEHGGSWFSSSVAVDQETLPPSLRRLVASGGAGSQRFSSSSGTELAVGVALPAVGAQYFEVFDLANLKQTLGTLQTALILAALVSTAAGGLGGLWVSRRVLRPVTEAAHGAVEIASGHLDTRLRVDDDGDLSVLAVSFNAMATSLAARLEQDARFASDVSHELRSPLTTLATSAQVLQGQRGQMNERSQRALDLLTGDLDRFQQLVEDLLEISRIDAGVPSSHVEPVVVSEFVRQCMAALGLHDVPLLVDPGASDRIVAVDKRRLERSMANLVGNARRHANGVAAVGVTGDAHHVRIAVDDAGPGVPPADRERIFERFSRGGATPRRASDGGVGLGLAIVSRHMQLLGGRVWVQDAPAGGARFVIELPVQGES
jgi:two-component system sensor histidine kinase MtrB